MTVSFEKLKHSEFLLEKFLAKKVATLIPVFKFSFINCPHNSLSYHVTRKAQT